MEGSAGCGALPMSNLGSALLSPVGVLRVYNASYNAVLARPHTSYHSVSCNDVL